MKGDTLDVSDHLILRKKGRIEFVGENEWTWHYSQPNQYSIDSCYDATIYTARYILHDSIYNVLKINGLTNCEFDYTYEHVLRDGNLIYDAVDAINWKGEEIVNITSDSIKSISLYLEYPVDYSGKFFLTIMNYFGEYLSIVETDKSSYVLNLSLLEREKIIFVKVTSEDCRESDEKAIILRNPTPIKR